MLRDQTRKMIGMGCCSLLMASADYVAAEANVLEEITVTARKRGAESIQDIGGSIQVLNGSDFKETVSMGFNDYVRAVPSLASNNAGAGQTQLSMRGINATRLNHANPNVPSTVGLYFGETPISTSGFNPDAGLFDLNRVEVLKGPQGTLFGASSMSGAIRLIPNDPNTEALSGSVNISGFSTEDGDPSYSGNGVINIPVTDNFAVRATGFSISNGGYIDNIYNGDDNYNDESIYGGRLIGLWNVTDSFDVKAMLMYQNTETDGRPEEQRRNDPAELTTASGFALALPSESNSQLVITDDLQNVKFGDDPFDDEFYLGSLQLDLELKDYSLTSVTSYFDRQLDNTFDDTRRTRNIISLANMFGAGGTTLPVLGDYTPGTLDGAIPITSAPALTRTENEKFTQEFRISSNFDGAFNFVAGIYYEDDSRLLDQDSILPGLDDWVTSPSGLDGFALGGTFGAVEENAYFVGIFDVETTQTALFFEATAELGDFELTAGGRYFDYEQEAFIHWQGWVEFGDDTLDEKISETGFSPKVEVTYSANEDVLLYAKAAKGFRLGSVQQFINPVFCGAELAGLGLANVPTSIDSDSLWNFEGGVKSTLFGGSTTANISVYHIDWEEARTQVFLSCGWIAEFSVVDMVSNGVEIELNSQVTDRLSLNFAAAYNESEADGDLGPSDPPIANDGDEAPFAPEWTMNAGFNYQREKAFDELDWFLRGDISYVSHQFSELGTQQLERVRIPSSTVLNLYTGVKADNWGVTLFVRNLTDERIVTGADTDRQRPAQFAIGRPRNVGVQFSYDF